MGQFRKKPDLSLSVPVQIERGVRRRTPLFHFKLPPLRNTSRLHEFNPASLFLLTKWIPLLIIQREEENAHHDLPHPGLDVPDRLQNNHLKENELHEYQSPATVMNKYATKQRMQRSNECIRIPLNRCINGFLARAIMITLILFFALSSMAGGGNSFVTGHSRQEREHIDALNQASYHSYTINDYEAAETKAREALKKAMKIHYDLGSEAACLTLAEIYYDRAELSKSMDYFKRTLSFKEADRDLNGQAYCLNNIGLLYRKMSRYEEAMTYYFMSLHIAEKINDLERIASATNNIGYIYDTLENYSRALEYHFRSLQCGEKLRDQIGIAKTLGNIGIIFRKQGEFEKALEYDHKALAIYETENDDNGKATILNNICNAYMSMNQLDKAFRFGKQALNLSEKLQDKELMSFTLSSLGDILLKKGHLEQALNHQKRALKYTTDNELRKNIYKSIISIYGQLNDDTNLIINHKLYTDAENHILTARANKKTRQLLITYDMEKKKKERELEEKTKQIDNLVFYLQLTGYLILILFIFILYSRFRNKTKLAKKLDLMSRIDPLTELPNRRDMIERMESETFRIGRTGKTFSLIMTDIDDFKMINDTYGHNTGDAVLKKVAQLLRQTIRKQDIVSRWGGEEFLLMLPDTDREGGSLIAEKIRERVHDETFSVDNQSFRVSITAGVSEYHPEIPIQRCIQRADDAMYQGKKTGKNKVVEAFQPSS
jgi:diguanylate cyclase (GGDEF)-like protein